jgi:hypothetical protein
MCCARGRGKCGKRRLVALIGIDHGVVRQSEGEGAEAGEEVGDALGASRPVPHQPH